MVHHLSRLIHLRFLAFLLAGLFAYSPALAQAEAPRAAPTATIEVQPLPLHEIYKPVIKINETKAMQAYLAQSDQITRSKAAAYTQENHLLLIASALYIIVLAGLLMWLRISAALRNVAQNTTRSRFWQVPIYFALIFAVTLVATLPLTLYKTIFREQSYGQISQSIPTYLSDFALQILIVFILLGITITLFYAGIRLWRDRWWLWGTVLTVIFLTTIYLITPFLLSLRTDYRPLPDGASKTAITALAQANGISLDRIKSYTSAQQSHHLTSSVSGLFGNSQIHISDTLLNAATPREIKAAVAHEIGHVVLSHKITQLLWLGLIALVGFWLANRVYRFLIGLFGGNWDVRTIEDPAGLPALAALAALYILLVTPALNTISRHQEQQADLFGLNAAREPDAWATLTIKRGTHHKLTPSPWEEVIFYPRPSGQSRVATAMRWKAAHAADLDIKTGPSSPQ